DGDEDLVVGEQTEVDGVGEGQLVGDGTENLFVVHGGDDFGVPVAVCVRVPDAGGGGDVEAGGGGELAVVVDGGPCLAEAACGSVGFVDDHEVPGGQVVVVVGGEGGGQGGVGGVGGDRPGAGWGGQGGELAGVGGE